MKNQYDEKFYKENGFVVIKNLLTSDEIRKYKKLMNYYCFFV